MHLQIVTPEAVVFDSEVKSVTVPGKEGAFQMLDHHAPIVSLLVNGEVKIDPAGGNNAALDKLSKNFRKEDNQLIYSIKGGVVEMSDNKAIVLAD